MLAIFGKASSLENGTRQDSAMAVSETEHRYFPRPGNR